MKSPKFSLQNVSVLLGCVVAATIIIGYLTSPIKWVDKRWAKAEVVQALSKDLDLVGKRLDQKIIQDRINAIQERLWRLEDKYGSIIADMASAIRDQYRRLLKELKDNEKRLKKS